MEGINWKYYRTGCRTTMHAGGCSSHRPALSYGRLESDGTCSGLLLACSDTDSPSLSLSQPCRSSVQGLCEGSHPRRRLNLRRQSARIARQSPTWSGDGRVDGGGDVKGWDTAWCAPFSTLRSSLPHSPVSLSSPFRPPTCSAYPPSSLFCSSLSPTLFWPHLASLSTLTSISWPSASMARIGMLASRTHGRAVSTQHRACAPACSMLRRVQAPLLTSPPLEDRKYYTIGLELVTHRALQSVRWQQHHLLPRAVLQRRLLHKCGQGQPV